MKKNIVISVLVAVLLISGVWGYEETKDKNIYKTKMINSYNENFASLLEDVRDIDTRLLKIKASNDLDYIKQELMYLYALSANSADSIKSLPVSQGAVSEISEFLNKCSNYYLALSKKIYKENKLTNDDKRSLDEIEKISKSVLENLYSMNDYMNNSKDGFDWERKNEEWYFSAEADDKLNNVFTSVTEDDVEYPTLIYDGPFSDDLKTKTAKGLGSKYYSKKEAEKLIEENLTKTNKTGKVKYSSESKNSEIDCFVFSVNLENDEQYKIWISKKGGHLILMTGNPNVSEDDKISIDEGKNKALEFVNDLNIKDMEVTYYETSGNVTTYNLAYNFKDITCYSDLIKVKVALDSGKIVGYEAKNYYMSHTERDSVKTILSEKEAKAKLNLSLNIMKTRLSYIPVGNGEEVLCYEFKGTIEKDIYLVYIDAKTGEERKILKVIEADNSILTM